MYKRLYLIGIAAYVIMLVLSILFYKERVFFVDTAFGMFHIVKDGTFTIQIFRFGDAITQVLPVLAVKAGLPISTVAMGYSVGYILCYFSCYLVTGFVLRRFDLALVILLLNLLFAADSFYWIPSELPQGIAYLVVLFAFLTGRPVTGTKIATWIMLGAALLMLAFFHPLLIIVLIYMVVFFWLREVAVIEKRWLYLIAGFYIAALIIKAVAFTTPYEAHSLSGMKNFVTRFPDYITLFSNKLFLQNCLAKYYWIPLLFSGIVIFYARTKAYRKLVFFAMSFFGYLALVNISYPDAVTPVYYIENLYLPLSVFLALPFLFDVLPAIGNNKTGMAVMILIMVTGCMRLYATHEFYSNRLALERKILDLYGDQKMVIKPSKPEMDQLITLWGTPYELLLLSECEQHKAASIIIDEDPMHRPWVVDQKKSLVVNYNIYQYSELNPKYFHFTDTVSGYLIDPK